jgi:hypothetical protein
MISLHNAEPGRFIEKGEGSDVLRTPGIQLHLYIFGLEDRIKANVCLGVGICGAEKIRVNWKMTPSPGF